MAHARMAVSQVDAPRVRVQTCARTSVSCARASEPNGRTAREDADLRAPVCLARARRSFLLQLMPLQLHSAFETDEVNAFD
ncbi:hypothetical protein Hanom_Chr01g00016151 [Helianthus anomalus]